jgi:ubiquitin-protein ligase
MSAFNERRIQDIAKLERLAASTNGKITILSKQGLPISEISIQLRYPTAASTAYPRVIQQETLATIQLAANYPFQEPTARLSPLVFHPNVFTNGRICLGKKWLPTEGLDLLVKRIIQIITFDPSILNERSPANPQALTWYTSAVRQYPKAFPTALVSFAEEPSGKGFTWKNLSS